MSQYLTNMVGGLDSVELSTLLRGNARFFSFIAAQKDEGRTDELELPDKSKIMYYYREEDFFFVESDTILKEGDEVVILTSSKHLADLSERWHPQKLEDHD